MSKVMKEKGDHFTKDLFGLGYGKNEGGQITCMLEGH